MVIRFFSGLSCIFIINIYIYCIFLWIPLVQGVFTCTAASLNQWSPPLQNSKITRNQPLQAQFFSKKNTGYHESTSLPCGYWWPRVCSFSYQSPNQMSPCLQPPSPSYSPRKPLERWPQQWGQKWTQQFAQTAWDLPLCPLLVNSLKEFFNVDLQARILTLFPFLFGSGWEYWTLKCWTCVFTLWEFDMKTGYCSNYPK